MMRALHKFPGLFAAVLIIVLALSGATLSVFPALDRAATPAQAEPGLSVAVLADRVLRANPGVEEIRRAPSGRITAFVTTPDGPQTRVIDPATGIGMAGGEPSPLRRWVTNLHRSLFLDDAGRLAAAAAAASLLLLSVAGLALTARRTGGWRRLFSRLRGPLAGRLHVEIARISVAGLLLTSVTALWMTAGTFGLLPDGTGSPDFPTQVSGTTGRAPADMDILRATPVATLRSLILALPGDATDALTLRTDAGEGYLDQGTGALLAWTDLGPWDRINETVYMLHTGQGAALLGLILGAMALGAPVMAATGLLLWLRGRRGRPRLAHNAGAALADTIVLVGSEGGTTWTFATTLHEALTRAGHRVHTGPMSGFEAGRYHKAQRLILLAATWGDGAAPATARGFIDKLAAVPQALRLPLVILGFGDRQFPAFCGYAHDLAATAEAAGWHQALPLAEVNRQSAQEFSDWGHALGRVLGHPLDLHHATTTPQSQTLTLISRRDYGVEVQAPTSILRFALPRPSLRARITGHGFARFAAGDLLGVVPEGATLPRLYSLASASRDGFVEICVRKHPGGLCSGQLTDLCPGQTVQAFVRPNPGFRPAPGKTPVILIGAGTGIGPLAGFARANRRHRPMHLFFGLRHPQSDLLYAEELAQWHASGRLTSLKTAFSRTTDRAHVQDVLRRDAARVRHLIAGGAQVLVCGGREMAAGVAATLADILSPAGLTPALLKAEGRYVEDVY